MKRWNTLWAVLILSPVIRAGQADDLFQSSAVGLELRKPASWVFLTSEDVKANRERIRLKDGELEQAIRERASLPLVVAAKYPEPHGSLNPTVQVGVRPLGGLAGRPATEILALVVGSLQSGFSDFQLVTPVSEARISGLPAAHLVATYTINTDAGSFPVKARMWLVPRGPILFMIGMSGAQEGEDVAQEEFQAVLESLVIEH